ncbi:restriction endonuclease subunit S [Aeromonas sanarellii]|uniref:Restriction endonuclease subunit S n=1 Tax=Aeromonas sanarellii TaxID=633415 RepID=A0ABS4B9L5_9GAMM|nr:restriction endonuclease subunit S [Aeromonas sanarellii]MBP0603411.1 restriction endonuclease subunit S [Aeromonas sanarellii]
MSRKQNTPNLPSGWKWVSLDEILINIIGGGTPSKSNPSYWSGNIPWLSVKDMKTTRPKETIDHISLDAVENSATNLIPADTLIVSTRMGLGKIVRVPFETTINQDLKALVLTESMNKSYVEYWYISLAPYIESLGTGTTVKGIRLEQLKALKLPLAPINIQKLVVNKIEEFFSHIDAGVEGLKQAKAKLQQYRQSVLKDAVTGKLTEQWREQNADKLEPAEHLLERILDERRANWEAEQLKAFEENGQTLKNDKWKDKYKVVHPLNGSDLIGLPKLPSGWCYAKLGQIIDEPRYGTSKKCTYESIGKGVLRIPNIAAGVIDAEDMKYAEFSDDEIATYKLNEGDILTIRSNGSVSLVGKCAVIEGKDTGFLYAGYLIRLRPILKYIDSHYLMNILSSGFLRKQIEHLAKSSSGVNNINAGEIQSLIVPICGLEEQHKIAKEIESKNVVINRQLQDYAKLVKQAEKSKASILNKAFSGELVENTYTDGTVVQLLGRIQAEKAQLEHKAKLAKKKPTARAKQMKRRPILDVLMESKKALNVDELFDLAGYQSEITPETVEEFYQELKDLTAITGVKVTPIKVDDVKQGDLFEYKECCAK